jgi:WD40 repeat protein
MLTKVNTASIVGTTCDVVFSADGSTAARSATLPLNGQSTTIWRTADGSVVATIDGDDPTFVGDGSTILTGGFGGARAWSAATGAPTATLVGPSDTGSGVFLRLSPDGTRVVVFGRRFARLFSVPQFEVIATMSDGGGLPEDALGAAFSADGERLALATFASALVFDGRTGVLRHRPNLGANPGEVLMVALDPTGSLLVIGGVGARPQLVELSSGSVADGLSSHFARHAAFSPDGSTLAVIDTEAVSLYRLT